jgi:serine protease Do
LNLQENVSVTPPKKAVDVVVLRDGKKKTLKLTTALMPNQTRAEGISDEDDQEEDNRVPATADWMGATFAEKEGKVIAVRVPPESLAADAGLIDGDEIHAINRAAVNNLKDFQKASSAAHLKDGVVFDITRKGKSFYLSYKTLQ